MTDACIATPNVWRDHYHGPVWRSELAKALLGPVESRPFYQPDELTSSYAAYLRVQGRHPSQAARRYPEFDALEQLTANSQLAKWARLMTCAGLSRLEIATRLSVDVQTVLLFEQLFWDVRDQVRSVIWMLTWVLLPLEEAKEFTLAAYFRAVLAGGPAVLDAVLTDEVEFPLEPGKQVFLQRAKLHALFKRALDNMPHNERTALKLSQMGFQMWQEEKRLELQERRFNEDCKRAAQEYELERDRIALRKEIEITRQNDSRLSLAAAELRLAELQEAHAQRFKEAEARRAAMKASKEVKWNKPKDLGGAERLRMELAMERSQKKLAEQAGAQIDQSADDGLTDCPESHEVVPSSADDVRPAKG